MTDWTSRPENRMVPILVPNIGFKQFGEIKPNAGIKNEFSLSITMQYHCSLHPISKLDNWLTNIQADRNSIQAILKLRNNSEDGSFKETYTGFLSLSLKVHHLTTFLALNHISAENISPSGVLSITPNEEMKRKRSQVSIQTMNLLKMKVKVLIYTL